ncbi:hypothetical protein [Mongoliibacter ruber]|nr:hypothetical protein [Mongoliibacter ruber]
MVGESDVLKNPAKALIAKYKEIIRSPITIGKIEISPTEYKKIAKNDKP